MNYDIFIAKKPGAGYPKVQPYSHYNEPIDEADGRIAGNSRRWGDASIDVQKACIDIILNKCEDYGLSDRETAHVLAIAYVESGFNPDAASNESAAGLGQFIDDTGAAYGLNSINRFDASANADALVRHYIDLRQSAANKGYTGEQQEIMIYKFYHDGFKSDHGGLRISIQTVMPLVDRFEFAIYADRSANVYGADYWQRLKMDGIVSGTQALYGVTKKVQSPIALDLDGDGIETNNINDGAYFDHDANGFAEQTGWVGSDDGILVYDRNNDGIINYGTETFGNNTLLLDGTAADNGFQALAELDDNLNGKIDANDAIWDSLKIWQDHDGDGYSSEDELWNPLDVGVSSINTAYTDSTYIDPNGNEFRQVGSFTRSDDTTGNAADVWFVVNRAFSIANEWLDVPEEIAVLPELQGYGNVYDLHQAMVRDTSGGLKALVEGFVAEADPNVRSNLMEQILLKWTGSEGVDPDSRGPNIDGQKLAVLEKLFADEYTWYAWPDPAFTAGLLLNHCYKGLFEMYYADLMAQTHLKELYEKIIYTWDETTQSLKGDLGVVVSTLQGQLTSDPAAGKAILGEFARSLRGFQTQDMVDYWGFRQTFASQSEELSWVFDSGGHNLVIGTSGRDSLTGIGFNDAIYGGDGDDILSGDSYNLYISVSGVLYGGAGNDTLTGYNGSDLLVGGSGNDTLVGEYHAFSPGGDILDGGPGKDSLQGGEGNDLYLFDHGYGEDTIEDYDTASGNVDTLRFASDIARSDVEITRNGNTLVFRIKGGGDQVLVPSGITKSPRQLERIEFGDGVILTGDEVTVISEEIRGTSVVDTLNGSSIRDRMYGEGGNDSIYGYGGDDLLEGGPGNDTLIGDWYQVSAADGNDTLDGGPGNDTLQGCLGNDTYLLGRGYGTDTISDYDTTPGNVDALRFASDIARSHVEITREYDNVVFKIKGTSDKAIVPLWITKIPNRLEWVEFGDGVVLTGDEVTMISEEIRGTSGIDILNGSSIGDRIYGEAGNDSIYGYAGDDLLEGGFGNDTLIGDWYQISATDGNDTLDGGPGNDTLQGCLGNDTYLFGWGYGADTISDYDTTPGNVDKIRFNPDVLPSDVKATKEGNNLVFTIEGTTDRITVFYQFYPYSPYNDYNRVERVEFWDGSNFNLIDIQIGGTGNDDLTGGPNDSIMMGDAGNDILKGDSGNDLINGGTGADSMIGAHGNDTYVVDNVNDTITEGMNAGTDKIWSSVNYALGPNVENLTLTGSADINATGNTLNNLLTGNAGANILDGGLGTDTLRGGLSDDIYFVDSVGDIVIEALSEGSDVVQSLVDYTLDENVENLTLIGTDTINGTGNDLSNILIGNTASNLLTGASGDDTLDGGPGNDSLEGGFGNDLYLFGRGYDQDTISDNDGDGDTLKFASDVKLNDVEITRVGDDVVFRINETSDQVRVPDWMMKPSNRLEQIEFGDETLLSSDYVTDLLKEIWGTSGNDDLAGTSDTDRIYGLEGDDILNGYAGDDLLVGGLGNDTYIVDSMGDTVSEALNEGVDTVQSSLDYTLGENLENLTLLSEMVHGMGNELSNFIIGNSVSNILEGAGGDDTLDGGGGADTLMGGLGNDTYLVDDPGDMVTEEPNHGVDTVMSSITLTLGPNLETLILAGTDRMNGTGNEMDNILIGNSGANTIDGGGGSDMMMGREGNDNYFVDTLRDQVFENANEGIDTIQSPIDWTLGSDVENLTLIGTAVNGFGNELENVLIGNSADNVLDGGAGTDALTGGLGNDTYSVDNKGDIIIEFTGEGTDLIYSSSDYTLRENIENLILTGNAGVAIGNDLNNVLTGNSASNELRGAKGDDTYIVGKGDRVFENRDEGMDIVQSSIDWTLEPNVETLTLVGTNAINGTGNELCNTLIGNSAPNILAGGSGDDTYIISSGDTVVENVNEGIDIILSTEHLILTENMENGTLTGSADINLIGNSLNNVLVGNDGGNTLNGAAGADAMMGGLGDDIYIVDNSRDNVTEAPDEGRDTIQSSISHALSANLENLTLIGKNWIHGIGNELDNMVTGNSGFNILRGGMGDDTLDGGGGIDILIGGMGDDTYVVSRPWDMVVEGFEEGQDTVESSINYTLGPNVENLILTGNAMLGNGNHLDNEIKGNASSNFLMGHKGDDRLLGGWGNDDLRGGAGEDLLDGGLDNDMLKGEEGNDTYLYGRGYGHDTISEHGNDKNAGDMDRVRFTELNPIDLIFVKHSKDLEILINNSSDLLTIENQNQRRCPQVEVFETSDGSRLLASEINLLIQEMAGFSAQNGGMSWTELIYNRPGDVQTVLAQYWEPNN